LITSSINTLKGSEVELLGGKGKNLLKMKEIGLPVPATLVLTHDNFTALMPEAEILEKIDKVRSKEQRASLLQDVRNKIDRTSVSRQILEKIEQEFHELGVDSFAVRSSCNVEDGILVSCAGQFVTFLNVRYEHLESQIKKCLMSTFSDSVAQYFDSFKLKFSGIKMAVVIQQMINSQKSGVCFTVNPINHQDEIVVEAAFGLGELIVSGGVNPDMYILEKLTGKMLSKSIGDKKYKIILKGGGSTIKIPVDFWDRFNDCLSDRELRKLYTTVSEVKTLFGNIPLDIEWSFDENGKFYILQARPITTINHES